MKQDQIESFLIEADWIKDRWGHFQKPILRKYRTETVAAYRDFRIKIQANSCRLEIRNQENHEWIRITSGFFKDITIVEKEGKRKIKIGSCLIGKGQMQ
jgi:hypothetical protein